ncbi:MAG: response regulator transcription factor [Bacteroidota bacterium]
MTKKIIIADDHPAFRKGLVYVIKEYFPNDLIVEVSNGHILLEKVQNNEPDLIVLDLWMPEIDGTEVVKRLTCSFTQIKILVITFFSDTSTLEELLQMGIHGYLTKDTEISNIVEAISVLRKGENYYNKEITKVMHDKLKQTYRIVNNLKVTERFTSKELKILKLLCEEKTSKEIANDIGMNVRTVENYRKSLLEKTGSKNSLGLVRFAYREKIVRM